MLVRLYKRGTREHVATAALVGGVPRVDCDDVTLHISLIAFLTAPHVLRWRDEQHRLQEKTLLAGSAEHFALRLDAVDELGLFAQVPARKSAPTRK